MKQYLFDTNALSEAPKAVPNQGFMDWFLATDESTLFTSCLALGEIQKGISLVASSGKRQQLDKWLTKTSTAFEGRIVGIDEPVSLLWGKLSAAGQKVGAVSPIIDTLIAAQCIHYNLILVTRNTKDFTQFTGLEVLCPWSD
jgi:predicted nucleic acid-binding protein